MLERNERFGLVCIEREMETSFRSLTAATTAATGPPFQALKYIEQNLGQHRDRIYYYLHSQTTSNAVKTLSSSTIRRRVAQQHKQQDGAERRLSLLLVEEGQQLVPPSVAQYIYEHRLFVGGGQTSGCIQS